MAELTLSFGANERGSYPILTPHGWDGAELTIPLPLACSYLDGAADELLYSAVDGDQAAGSWSRYGAQFAVTDTWRRAAPDRIRLERRLHVSCSPDASLSDGAGVQLHVALELGSSAAGWRFFAPGILYSPDQFAGQTLTSFSDGRLAYPLIAAYHQASGATVCISRVTLADYDTAPVRPNKEGRFIQQTDLGALGYSHEGGTTALHLFWPYYEGERSASLDAAGSPASAFYPLAGDLDTTLSYEIFCFEAGDFSAAVLGAFKNACSIAAPESPALPFSLDDAVSYRLDSLAKTYAEWDEGGAGFILNFDPEQGYETQPKAFGASFTEHRMNDSHSILEYGFTGRQLNAAYVLAERDPATWLERGKRVSDFLVRTLAQPSGWIFTLYHLDKGRPIYTCGDPAGPVMHYLAESDAPGNYLRMMVEAAGDLLLNYGLHRQHGAEYPDWLGACMRFGDFLLRCQNSDGSWYRAYTPDDDPLLSGWFGATTEEAKSATSIPVPYLLALANTLGAASETYVAAAQRAGRYVLAAQVAGDEYRGGTLDNPNVVDKEASMLALKSLLHLYEHSGERDYLVGAERAARLAISWNLIWNIPLVPGTRLAGVGVNSIGWGGINSIWGAGVGDIYSLFFLPELVRLSRLTGEPIYEAVADLIAHGTAQILSYPGNMFGFADTGMQPEGISFCPQGVDSGLIAKGDIWGGLGWIYTAGTFGLGAYLSQKRG